MPKRAKRGRIQRDDDLPTDPPEAPDTKKRKTPKSKKRKSSETPEEGPPSLRLKYKKEDQDEPAEAGKAAPSRGNQTSPAELCSLLELAKSESSETFRGLVEVHNPSQIDQKWLELPIPPNKELCKWPRISFGDHAPTPRWRIVKDDTDPAEGRDVSQDLIKTRSGRTIIKRLRPGAVAHSLDTSIGLSGLAWKFDPGSAMGWGQLSDGELYEFAFRCLEAALGSQVARQQLREAITKMPLGDAIAHVEDPLPPIPSAPPKSDFGEFHGLHGIDEAVASIKQIPKFWNTSERPSLAVREKENVKGARKNENVLVDRMFLHMAGAMGRSNEISLSYDSDSHDSDDSAASQSTGDDPPPDIPPCPLSLIPVSSEAPASQAHGESMPGDIKALDKGIPGAAPDLEPNQNVEKVDVDPVGECDLHLFDDFLLYSA